MEVAESRHAESELLTDCGSGARRDEEEERAKEGEVIIDNGGLYLMTYV